MRSIHLLCACLAAVAILSGCDKEPPAAPKAPPAPPPLTTAPEPAKVPAVPPMPPAAVEPAPAAPPPVPAPKTVPAPPAPEKPKAPPVSTAVTAPVPKAKLDLSLPKELVNQLDPSDPKESQPDQPLLPQMFVEKPLPESPFQLNGKLITNEREDDYWRSVEGAELQFEFKR